MVGQIADSSHAPIAISFFTGAMGLDLGLEQAGFAVRLASEIDEDAVATIKLNRPHIPVIGDIHQYTARQARDAVGIGDAEITVVVGGPPCQAFSSAGKRQGLDDVRGLALPKLASLAVELNPRYIVIENVRGLLAAGDGEVLDKILAMLKSGGYEVSFELYDAAYFGVPQHRDRVIIIASRDGRVPYLTPTHSDRPEDGLPPWKTLRDAIGDMNGVEHHHVQFPAQRLEYLQKLQPGQNWRDLSDEDQKSALSEAVRDAEGGKTGFYRRLAWDEPCPTLISLPNMPATDLCHPEELRPLSVEEYKRIQGFPDHWQLRGDIESNYRQIANAVPVRLGEAVGRTILEHMQTHGSEDPAPGFRYSRYARTSEREWITGETAQARLAELAKAIRGTDDDTKQSLRVAVQNTLPLARKAGDLLSEAKAICKRNDILWEPWVRENCGMSERTAQGYLRIATNWEKISEAQSSAPVTSIDAALKLLAHPNGNGKPRNPEPIVAAAFRENGEPDPATEPSPAGDSEEHSAIESSDEPEAPEESYDDSDECGEAATDIFYELKKARRYFDTLAIVVAQSDWSRFERDLLHLEITSLMRVLNETASALASQGGLHRSCALLIAYPGDNDKHEAKAFLARAVDAARTALEWGELQKVVTAAKLDADGVKTELL
jgi:DNA (cytosine-5)-methyltransferase 1